MVDVLSGTDHRARARPPEGVQLTTVGEKLEWYGFDPYFRDGCDDVRAIMDGGGKVDLWNSSFLIFRPDAVVTRSVSRGIEVLLENGFSILKIYEFQYTYLSVREELALSTQHKHAGSHRCDGSLDDLNTLAPVPGANPVWRR